MVTNIGIISLFLYTFVWFNVEKKTMESSKTALLGKTLYEIQQITAN